MLVLGVKRSVWSEERVGSDAGVGPWQFGDILHFQQLLTPCDPGCVLSASCCALRGSARMYRVLLVVGFSSDRGPMSDDAVCAGGGVYQPAVLVSICCWHVHLTALLRAGRAVCQPRHGESVSARSATLRTCPARCRA